MRRTWFVFAFSTLAAVACGGSVENSGSGGTQGSGGSGGGSGGSGGGTGGSGGSATCQDLQAQFGAALAQAKNCDPFANSLQCTFSFKSAVACGCPTYVNPANAGALSELMALEKMWKDAGCYVPCPGSCPAPQGSSCAPNGQGGDAASCQDFF